MKRNSRAYIRDKIICLFQRLWSKDPFCEAKISNLQEINLNIWHMVCINEVNQFIILFVGLCNMGHMVHWFLM